MNNKKPTKESVRVSVETTNYKLDSLNKKDKDYGK
jgi:hypothetical protein